MNLIITICKYINIRCNIIFYTENISKFNLLKKKEVACHKSSHNFLKKKSSHNFYYYYYSKEIIIICFLLSKALILSHDKTFEICNFYCSTLRRTTALWFCMSCHILSCIMQVMIWLWYFFFNTLSISNKTLKINYSSLKESSKIVYNLFCFHISFFSIIITTFM